MENTNPQIMETQVQPKSKKKWMVGAIVIVAVTLLGYVGYKNPQLFRASITEGTVPAGAGNLYIPNYTASAGDTGTITLKSNLTSAVNDVNSISFKLKYTPTNAIKFAETALVLDADTVVKSGTVLPLINAEIPGELNVALLFAGAPVDLPTGTQSLLKLKLDVDAAAAPGTVIQMTASDVEFIDESLNAVPALNAITAGTITIQSQNNLKLLRAEAISATQVKLYFSDYLKNYAFNASNYSISGGINATAGTLETDQKSVLLTVDTLTATTEYTVQVTGLNGNTAGGVDSAQDAAFFTYHSAPVSAVKVSQINVLSATSVDVVLTGAVQASTVTPLNILVKSFNPAGIASELTVTNATVQGNTLKLTTAKQAAKANYFILFNGVMDTATTPLALGNNAPMNFFGFIVPEVKITSITPSSINNDADQNVVVVGENLNTIEAARLGQTAVNFTRSAGTLTLVVPTGFKEGTYDLTLTNGVGENITKAAAVVVTAVERPMKVISEESRATPNRVAPDETTKVKFWVLVEDPVDLNSVQSVTINLEQIGGSRAQEMVKDTGTQPQFRQWYVYETTVAKQTPTKDTPYLLPIEVRKGENVVKGTVELTVSKDLYKSVAPTIDQVYFSPTTVPPDGQTEVKLSAKVTDLDGADTIQSVVANLGPVGAGFVTLTRLDVGGVANEQVTGWFQSESFTVPTSTKIANYTVAVTASDATGETSTQTLTLAVDTAGTGPTIDPKRTYLTPRQSVPKDGRTTFGIQTFVSDPDGLDDVVGVTADFRTLGLPPVTLAKAADAPATGKAARFGIEGLTIPTTAPAGVHEIEIVATDASGATTNTIVRIDVTYKDTVGEAPMIEMDRSYTAPKTALNDGTTPISLYVFVRDDDDDVETVIANLSQIGQVGPETVGSLKETGAAAPASAPAPTGAVATPCSTGSSSIVCMTPSVKEGREGQWFILTGVTISKSTAASQDPYAVEIIATDKLGKTDRATLNVYVSDSARVSAGSQEAPVLGSAVATSETTVELAFSQEISAASFTSAGAEFTISDRADINAKLNVLGATINSSGTIVTLTTEAMESGKAYVVTASNRIIGTSGKGLAGNRADLLGYKPTTGIPVIEYIASSGGNTVEVEFRDAIRPSTADQPGSVVIVEDGTENSLEVTGVSFQKGNTLVVKTENQTPEKRYRLVLKGIASAGGNVPTSAQSKIFKGFKGTAVQRAALGNAADLNGDGKVDFTDFTMFSAVYGSNYGASASTPAPQTNSQNLQPIPPVPDATVPVEQVPTGTEF